MRNDGAVLVGNTREEDQTIKITPRKTIEPRSSIENDGKMSVD